MVGFVNNIPWYVGVVLLIVVIVALTIALFYGINKTLQARQFPEVGDVTSYTLNTISIFYCLFVAFIFIDVQSQHNQIQDIVVKESSLLLDIYNTSKDISFFDNVKIKKAVQDYAINVFQKELPLMVKGDDDALVPYIHPENLWKSVASANPENFKELALYQSMLERMNSLTDTRFQRFTSVDGRTNPFLWTVLIYGGIIVIFTEALFSSKAKALRLLLMGFSVSLIVLVLALIYSLDKPFCGETAVSLTSFEEVLRSVKG